MRNQAFVYTELQMSLKFEDAPWNSINAEIKDQPGFVNKTWLAGSTNESLGGLYTFATIKDAQRFVTGYFPNEARKFGVGQTTRIFDSLIAEDASRDMNSMHFEGKIEQDPGAFVYTEVQVNVPFPDAPWQEINAGLKSQSGILAKTWLSGLHNNTLGGLYAFDTLENAKEFALNAFPEEAANLNAAFYTRVFNASETELGSRDMYSPFYA